jgi:hypothetical protein
MCITLISVKDSTVVSFLQALKDIPRNAYYIATKVGRYERDPRKMFDFSRDKTLESVDHSLKLLGLDYVDIIQVGLYSYAKRNFIKFCATLVFTQYKTLVYTQFSKCLTDIKLPDMNTEVHHTQHRISSTDPTLCHFNTIHIFTYFFTISFNGILLYYCLLQSNTHLHLFLYDQF